MGVARSQLWAPATNMAALSRGCKPIIQTNLVNTDSVMDFPRSSSFCRHTTLRALLDDPKLERLLLRCPYCRGGDCGMPSVGPREVPLTL